MTDIVVYTGTSLTWQEAGEILDADYQPPVKRNDINILLDKRMPDIIGIIDGIFFDRAAVAHKEIMRAIEAGVTVVGGSSMGALRAFELQPYGMIGVGCIYQLYRDGIIDSDDEVAVTFHPETLEPLSIPLVNIRGTLEQAADAGVIDINQGYELLEIAKSMYYPERTIQAIVKKGVVSGVIPGSRQDDIMGYLIGNEVDIKREDALLVIKTISELSGPQ